MDLEKYKKTIPFIVASKEIKYMGVNKRGERPLI
jgi:hypothetical protein